MCYNPLMHIYLVTNRINGKQYVGQTIMSVQRRWNNHCYLNTSGSSALGNAIRKYGRDAFSVEHIASAETIGNLNLAEQILIVQYGTQSPAGYNLTEGGRNARVTPEAKAKISVANKGKARHTSEWKAALSQKMKGNQFGKGVVASPETRAKMSVARVGRTPRKRGSTQSPEVRARMSASHIGKVMSPETRARMSAAKKGQYKRTEARTKANAARRGVPLSVEHRAKITASLMGNQHTKGKTTRRKGQKHTAESVAKMSAAHRARHASKNAEKSIEP